MIAFLSIFLISNYYYFFLLVSNKIFIMNIRINLIFGEKNSGGGGDQIRNENNEIEKRVVRFFEKFVI